MNKVIASLTVALSLVSGLSAFAAPDGVQDKTLSSAQRTIKENCKLVHEYAPMYEWNNVDREVDRIVAAEKRIQKVFAAMPEKKQHGEELRTAVNELRKARFDQDVDRAVSAAEKVETISDTLVK